MIINTKYSLGDIFVRDRDVSMITEIQIKIFKPTLYRLGAIWYSEIEVDEQFSLLPQKEILEQYNPVTPKT
jgi:hypothetical protein